MTKMDSPRIIAKYINCLSILEDKTALLYSNLSDGTEIPLIKSLLLSISKDSSKHSALLKGIADSISDSKQSPKDCEKKLGEVWRLVSTLHNEAINEDRLGELDFSELMQMLDALESSFGEEYHIFVQMKTLQLMVKEINQLYNVNLEKVKDVFESIIKDEEHHREILAAIVDIVGEESMEHDNTPLVKFQNPDAWSRSLPPTTYDSR